MSTALENTSAQNARYCFRPGAGTSLRRGRQRLTTAGDEKWRPGQRGMCYVRIEFHQRDDSLSERLDLREYT